MFKDAYIRNIKIPPNSTCLVTRQVSIYLQSWKALDTSLKDMCKWIIRKQSILESMCPYWIYSQVMNIEIPVVLHRNRKMSSIKCSIGYACIAVQHSRQLRSHCKIFSIYCSIPISSIIVLFSRSTEYHYNVYQVWRHPYIFHCMGPVSSYIRASSQMSTDMFYDEKWMLLTNTIGTNFLAFDKTMTWLKYTKIIEFIT